jgi:hypothetical protein
MREYMTQILSWFATTFTFNSQMMEGWPLLVAAIVFYGGVYFFAPKLKLWYQMIRRRRMYWRYQVMLGRKMTTRKKNTHIGERLYEMLLAEVKKGEITHKDKRRYLRLFELMLELEPGTITPKPSVKETKRKILGRLSAKAANVVSISPKRRLAALITRG